jgi:hypothetical protein
VILDGEVESAKRISKNDVLARFIQSLANAEGLPEKRRALVNSLRVDLAHVRFLPPEGYSQYDFHAPHIDGIDWIPNQEIEEWGIISPFLTKGAMDALGEGLTEPSFVLSRDEELAKVGGIPNGMVLRDVEELSDDDAAVEPIQVSGLHAKCYMYDYTYMNLPFTRLVVGSGNATSAALVNSSPRNVEFMVSLSFVKRLSQKIRVPAPVINAILFGVVTVYLYVLPRGNIFNILFCINLYWHYYPFFMMGYYSYKLYKFMTWNYVPIYLIIFLVSLHCIHVRGMNMFVPIGNLSSLLLLITLFKNGCRPFETFLAKLGVMSLQIYLLHFSILFIVLPYLPVIENRWLEFLLYFVVAFSFIMLSVDISKVLMRSRLLSLLLFGIKKK